MFLKSQILEHGMNARAHPMPFLAKPRERNDHILHNDKLPNSFYAVSLNFHEHLRLSAYKKFASNLPRFLSLTHFKPMFCFYTPCKRQRFDYREFEHIHCSHHSV